MGSGNISRNMVRKERIEKDKRKAAKRIQMKGTDSRENE